MDREQLLIFMLVALCIGGMLYVFVYPYLSGEVRAEKRQKAVQGSAPRDRSAQLRNKDLQVRRTQISETLKEFDERQKKRRIRTINTALEQAGLGITKERFYVVSAVIGGVLGVLMLIVSHNIWIALACVGIGGFGLPRWILEYLSKRRQAKFIEEFPNAIDIIIRGIKAGLPFGDCIRIVASESQEPAKSEFRSIVEMQAVGMPTADAVQRMCNRIGLPETNFFAITIGIQQKAGGSMSEILGNLSRVLRERKKMKAKVRALSAEAKASALIIGSLPLIVTFLVYVTSPKYIEVLWTTDAGLVLLGGSGFWMAVGSYIMRNMIRFDF